MTPKKFTLDYVKRLKILLDNINTDSIEKIIKQINLTVKNNSKVYLLGNGGSSATASHMANDLGAGLRRRGLINIDSISLSDNSPVVTAIANDIGYDQIFYMQLYGLLKNEDLVIAISCSGNSPNIINAVKYAKEIGSCVIGVTGFDGGKLKSLSDIEFHVAAKKNEYGLVEDVHMILDHILYSYFLNKK
jgi:D-sedoheptulose 7-phosphate isomerase